MWKPHWAWGEINHQPWLQAVNNVYCVMGVMELLRNGDKMKGKNVIWCSLVNIYKTADDYYFVFWTKEVSISIILIGQLKLHVSRHFVITFLKWCFIVGMKDSFPPLRKECNGYNVPSVTACAYVGWHMEIQAFQPNFLLSLCPPTRTTFLHWGGVKLSKQKYAVHSLKSWRNYTVICRMLQIMQWQKWSNINK